MTTSTSTPRLRVLQLWYAALLVLVAISARNGSAAMSLAGLLLMTAAALGRIWTSAFIAGHKDIRLVTAGPYSLCRHPLYALSLLGAAGVGLSTRSWILTAATVILSLALHLRAIRAEERNLQTWHGQAFEHYRAKIPKLFPSLAHYECPETTPLNLLVFRKSFADAAAFLLLYLLIQSLDALRATGLWRTLFQIP